ncbi:GNAT family N-acetyltransferase [Porifericola rhodea]|uniref:GNAT family N-acetyltransferase n=1 Tax=Porifericola rhodea TaxID=930972 RepID=UPI00266683D8|nr:GNAT family N-acetyltransferase [Porifericola rhodea]WKN29885.1 GNAT family N-acetyltransferase [Porifericola rhodea]
MLKISQITAENNIAIAQVIRQVMADFDVDPSTTIVGDPTLDRMYETYQQPRAIYYVAFWNDVLVGGCGIRKLDGTEENICELQRMFLLHQARGKGIAKQLMELCLQKAKEFAYAQIYIETLSQMHEARSLYHKFGFKVIDNALGDTGHCGCDIKMLKKL